MRLALLARCDDRGLGVMSMEIYRHLNPDRTLVIREPGAEAKGFAPHLDRFPGATVTTYDGGLDEAVVRPWLRGADALYTAETPYSYALYDWARAEGVRSICHVMPEFWPYHASPDLPRPDVVWLPTTWRREHLPPAARMVPVPVAAERFSPSVRSEPTFLHVVGHRAARDRAGTASLNAALRMVRQPMRLIVATQDRQLPFIRVPRNVTLEQRRGGVANYWDNYSGASVLVGPRRYGGLSLPFNEAAAAGLALMLSDVDPNRHWPGVHVEARQRGSLTTAAGEVAVHDTDPRAMATAMDALAADPARVAELSTQSLAWAAAHSWDVLAPLWRDELDRACA